MKGLDNDYLLATFVKILIKYCVCNKKIGV